MNFGLVDAHAHLRARASAREALLTTMDRFGIERSVVVPGGTVSPDLLAMQIAHGGALDVDADNHGILESCGKSGGRLVPFYFANPHRGAGAYRVAGRDFYGLKLGPAVHGVPFGDPRVAALVAQAERFGHPVYLHCLPREPFGVAAFVALAKAFRGVTFILGHAGVGQCDFDAVTSIQSLDHVMFELSGGMTAVCAEAVFRLGAQRVLFGSEYPLQDPRVEIAKLHALELGESDLRTIARDNALRLIARKDATCAA